MSQPTDNQTIWENLLERRIDAIKDAIARARTTWMFATLLTFIFATVIYNATYGYNTKQLRNRAKLAHVTSQAKLGIDNSITKDPLVKIVLSDGDTYLGYLKELMPQSNDQSELDELRAATRFELQQRIIKQTSMDSLTIPLIGVTVVASDVGIIGSAALIIVGYWLLAALRRENHAFGEFIRRVPDKLSYTTEHSGYSSPESAYAYHAVSHYMIFGASRRESAINRITFAGFIVPPALMCFNHLTTAVMAGGGLGGYFQTRILVEAVLTTFVVVVWIRALIYQLETVNALQAWCELHEAD